MAEIKNIRIAISGIYDYAQEELASLRLDLPGTGKAKGVQEKRVYQVYRPSLVLERAKDKFKLLPLTHHHPQKPVDGKNFRKLAVGYTGENTYIDFLSDKNEVGIRSNLVLYDDESLEAYNRGEIQLSPGYVGVFEWKQGVSPNGQAYDIIMQEIETVNHLALLPAGRGGAEAIILDKSIETHKTVFELASERLQAFDGDFKEDLHKRDKGGKFATSNEGKEGKKDIQSNKKEIRKNCKVLNRILSTGKAETVKNKEIGDIVVEAGETKTKEKNGYGLKHIIEERYKKDKRTEEETSAMLPLIFDVVKNGKEMKGKKFKRTINLEKGAFIAIIRKQPNDKNSQWVLSGFDNNQKEKEATGAIKTVSATNSYAPEYSDIRKQVGAVIASLDVTIPDNAPKVNTIFSLIKNEKFTVFTLAKMTIGVTDI